MSVIGARTAERAATGNLKPCHPRAAFKLKSVVFNFTALPGAASSTRARLRVEMAFTDNGELARAAIVIVRFATRLIPAGVKKNDWSPAATSLRFEVTRLNFAANLMSTPAAVNVSNREVAAISEFPASFAANAGNKIGENASALAASADAVQLAYLPLFPRTFVITFAIRLLSPLLYALTRWK